VQILDFQGLIAFCDSFHPIENGLETHGHES
jgi:hypothetical protein